MHRLNLCVRADEVQMCLCEHSYAHNNAFWCVRQGQELPISLSEWVGSEVGRQYMKLLALYVYVCMCNCTMHISVPMCLYVYVFVCVCTHM